MLTGILLFHPVYRSLDYLQLKNGTEQLVLNRDDAAGFRLDTTFTHKQHKGVQLLDSHDLTSRTNYMNKYTSVLQMTSYLFPSTSSTPPTCVGVVKPHVIFEKNRSQHMADLNMQEKLTGNEKIYGTFALMEAVMKALYTKKYNSCGRKNMSWTITRALW